MNLPGNLISAAGSGFSKIMGNRPENILTTPSHLFWNIVSFLWILQIPSAGEFAFAYPSLSQKIIFGESIKGI
jgi:hypothetical protein